MASVTKSPSNFPLNASSQAATIASETAWEIVSDPALTIAAAFLIFDDVFNKTIVHFYACDIEISAAPACLNAVVYVLGISSEPIESLSILVFSIAVFCAP